jgi:pimeloyl-ACP methyl ester carboxylesterase
VVRPSLTTKVATPELRGLRAFAIFVVKRPLGIHNIVLKSLVFGVVTLIASPAFSQPASPQIVDVDGRPMRVLTSGLAARRSGQAVVILEAGAGEGLDNWRPAFADIARVAPVIAYDRRGVGQSAPDSETPTLRRVAASLHSLLATLAVPPPYVLVGHSWGGLFVRAYVDRYANDVAGLVFLDVTDFETTPAEKAAAVSPGDRASVLAPPTLPPIPPDTPPGLRAEFAVVASEMTNDFPEARSLRAPSGMPIAVVVATPPGRLQGPGGVMVRLQMKHQAEWALASPKGLFIAADHVGHMVHRDDPALVVRMIEHVLQNATQR